jgi:5-methyltetrahydropteroyltriglutamate--homocysteine methyltransferase
MQASRERILTTHTGSLPRPFELVDMYARRSAGETIDEGRLDQVALTAMRDVVEKQMACGIDVGNNGEQQRESFFLYVQRRMTGFGGHWKRTPHADVERYPQFKAMQAEETAARHMVNPNLPPKAIGEVRYRDPAGADTEPSQFREALDGIAPGFVEAFMTAPSPGIIAAAVKNEHYATLEAYVGALAEALRLEYEAIARHGFVLQIDCPDLALEKHRTYQDRSDKEFLGFVELIVGAINQATASIPRERKRLHVCWGNYEGPHDCDVPLETIWPVVLQADVGGFVLPFANARHAHEFQVLRDMPLADDQMIVAGVIDSVTNFVEHPKVVANRLEAVVDAVGDPSRVLAGTDCGFDTQAGKGRVAEDVVWAKLRALVEGARIASARLGLPSADGGTKPAG